MKTINEIKNHITYENILKLIENSNFDFSNVFSNVNYTKNIKYLNQFDLFKTYNNYVYLFIFIGVNSNNDLLFIPYNVHNKQTSCNTVYIIKHNNFQVRLDNFNRVTILSDSLLIWNLKTRECTLTQKNDCEQEFVLHLYAKDFNNYLKNKIM